MTLNSVTQQYLKSALYCFCLMIINRYHRNTNINNIKSLSGQSYRDLIYNLRITVKSLQNLQ